MCIRDRARISPDIRIVTIMANHMSGDAFEAFDLEKEIKSGGMALLSSGRKALDIPAQMSDFLKMTIKGQTKICLLYTSGDGPMDEKDVRQAEIRFKQGIDEQRAEAIGADPRDQQDKFPRKLHQHADSQNPKQRILFFLRRPDIVQAQNRISHKQKKGHDAVITARSPRCV